MKVTVMENRTIICYYVTQWLWIQTYLNLILNLTEHSVGATNDDDDKATDTVSSAPLYQESSLTLAASSGLFWNLRWDITLPMKVCRTSFPSLRFIVHVLTTALCWCTNSGNNLEAVPLYSITSVVLATTTWPQTFQYVQIPCARIISPKRVDTHSLRYLLHHNSRNYWNVSTALSICILYYYYRY